MASTELRLAKPLQAGDATLVGSPELGAFGVVLGVTGPQAFVLFQSGVSGRLPLNVALLGRNLLDELLCVEFVTDTTGGGRH